MATKTDSPARRKAALAGTNGKPKQVDFRGLKLNVPAKCPGAVLFDIGEDNVSGTLRTLLGSGQYTELRDKVSDDGLSLSETVDELTGFLNSIFSDTYGLTTGE